MSTKDYKVAVMNLNFKQIVYIQVKKNVATNVQASVNC